ncbi:MAG: aminoglycoside phosphotransferase family protein [Chitinophagaceae bacterium]|nr:aminoglycoside phosphotransferase family protein [Chitinophagaceae bacterium]
MNTTTTPIPSPVLEAWGLHDGSWQIIPFGTGLINHTWKLERGNEALILQRINHNVFKTPHDIAHNMTLIGDFLQQHHPSYHFVAVKPTLQGQPLFFVAGHGYYRVFPFVQGSHTIDVVNTPGQAFEAARQFGLFTKMLTSLDVSKLRTTIPGFHDLTSRYQQFLKALETGDRDRRRDSAELIQQVISFSDIVTKFEAIRKNPDFKLRVIHHDTKISNVLFNNEQKAVCVIDLDTVMPGYFISDLGDMMRTYLSPVSEEEKDIEKINVRAGFYKAIMEGYLSAMKPVLSQAELDHAFYSGQFMIFMQAIRFLTDHLQNDVYYGAAYPGHNFHRARNQLTLLSRLTAHEKDWTN